MIFEKLSAAIYNDVYSGLRGYSNTPTMSLEQLEDDVVDERLQVIKEYILKGLVPRRDLLYMIPCIEVDCQSLERCPCGQEDTGEKVTHFEIPQLLNDFGFSAIEYIGAIDLQLPFVVYYSPMSLINHKWRKRGKDKPYVFINMAPNENNMLDCYVFNAPYLTKVSVIGIFKDPRQLENYACCTNLEELDNMSVLNNEIKRRLTEKKIRYYRQLLTPVTPNDQIPK